MCMKYQNPLLCVGAGIPLMLRHTALMNSFFGVHQSLSLLYCMRYLLISLYSCCCCCWCWYHSVSVSVCLSVCLSVTLIDHVKTLQWSFMLWLKFMIGFDSSSFTEDRQNGFLPVKCRDCDQHAVTSWCKMEPRRLISVTNRKSHTGSARLRFWRPWRTEKN